METVQNTISTSLSQAGFVGMLIFHIILNWVCKMQKLYSTFRTLLQSKHDFEFCDSMNGVEKKDQNTDLATKQVFLGDKASGHFCLQEERDDGKISRGDMEMVMENLGIFCDPDDERLQGRIGFKEFSVLFEDKEPSLEEVKEAFDLFDKNKDRFIDEVDLQSVLCSLGFSEGLEMEKCRRMIETFDTNGDGKIDFMEFLKLTENSF